MESERNQLEKICGFYVSNWHLATMLLPYINSKIDNGANVITILENNIVENIKTLVEKLNLKNEDEILNIRWQNVSSKKYTDIEAILNNEISSNFENIILINGSKDYIEKNNLNIKKWTNKNSTKFIKIVNLFEVTDFNNNILGILDSHDRVLNTSGEKEITDVFEGYYRSQMLENTESASNN